MGDRRRAPAPADSSPVGGDICKISLTQCQAKAAGQSSNRKTMCGVFDLKANVLVARLLSFFDRKFADVQRYALPKSKFSQKRFGGFAVALQRTCEDPAGARAAASADRPDLPVTLAGSKGPALRVTEPTGSSVRAKCYALRTSGRKKTVVANITCLIRKRVQRTW